MKRNIIIAIVVLLLIMLFGVYSLLAPLTPKDTVAYVYVRPGNTRTTILSQLDTIVAFPQRACVHALAILTGYGDNPYTGRYIINHSTNAFTFYRALHGGRQLPVKITIPMVRTMQDLSKYLGERLMLDSTQFLQTIYSPTTLAKYRTDTANVYTLFIPNTYELYWNISAEDFISRMQRESSAFWTEERRNKAAAIPMTSNEVYTLASIIDEETANNREKPDIAGMYINRLRQNMPLQADPTVKFALNRFKLRRIYYSLLDVDSPYNTYRHEGLPPGPIRIASISAIEAVLNYTHHDYLYMCAKEDFSGTHRFARTYSEHLANAARYSKALDQLWIK